MVWPVLWPVLWPDLARSQNLLYLCGVSWPVLGRMASFETGVATDLATTFRWNCNVLPLLWPDGQFCSDYQEMSEFTIYIASIRTFLGNWPRVLYLRRGMASGEASGGRAPYLNPTGSRISACTIDRVANIDHNEGDGTSIFWTLFPS